MTILDGYDRNLAARCMLALLLAKLGVGYQYGKYSHAWAMVTGNTLPSGAIPLPIADIYLHALVPAMRKHV